MLLKEQKVLNDCHEKVVRQAKHFAIQEKELAFDKVN